MGSCLKGKSEVKDKAAKFECKKCGAKASDKGHVCKPKKVDSSEDKKKKKKKKKD
jgi:hypothetical protein